MPTANSEYTPFSVQGVVGAASGAGIAIGTYFAFYGAASNALARTTTMKPGGLLQPCNVPALEECCLCCGERVLQSVGEALSSTLLLCNWVALMKWACATVYPEMLQASLEVRVCSLPQARLCSRQEPCCSEAAARAELQRCLLLQARLHLWQEGWQRPGAAW